MKASRFNIFFALAASLTGAGAFAQSNNGVPGPQDYAKFGHFIADRNIFDPNRQPHYYNSSQTYHPHPIHHGMPTIQFVGTMSYNKGLFAFFSGNSSDLSQVSQVGSKVAGYTITEITPDFVALESADKKDEPKLKVGSGFQEENGKWVVADAIAMASAESASASGSSGGSSTSTGSTGSTSSTPAPPPSTGEQNDVLKRLMQKREKENQ
jgi:hypothetical protein